MAVSKECDPQPIDFLGNDNLSRCELQERRGRREAISDTV